MEITIKPAAQSLPSPLRGQERGSFAHRSVVERLPRIGRRVLAENDFTPDVAGAIQALLDEIPEGRIRLLRDRSARDTAAWIEYVAPHLESNWLEVPWFFAETYFYRRILEATRYFKPGADVGADPFRPHKEQSLTEYLPAVRELAGHVASLPASPEPTEGVLADFVYRSLWGNQGDLSMWPTGHSGGEREKPGSGQDKDTRAAVVVDDVKGILAHLDVTGSGSRHIAFLLDNAGLELVSDLALAVSLLVTDKADAVDLHLKTHPTFVSDVTADDLHRTISTLAQDVTPDVQALAASLDGYLEAGAIKCHRHFFWTSPLPMWEMPADLRARLAQVDLVIAKGDANYRRLLGDRHWPYTTSFASIVSYFPAPLAALRTLKSEVAAGLTGAQLVQLGARDREWLTSGRWGMIQFVRSPAQGAL